MVAIIGLIFNIVCDASLSESSKLKTDPSLAIFLGYYDGNAAKNYIVYSIMVVVSIIEIYIYKSHSKISELGVKHLLVHKKFGESFFVLFYMAVALIMFDTCVDQSLVQLFTLCMTLLIAISRILGQKKQLKRDLIILRIS
jgi:hypothetical protein